MSLLIKAAPARAETVTTLPTPSETQLNRIVKLVTKGAPKVYVCMQNSVGVYEWVQGVWHFMGVSRSGSSAVFYRNGVALATACSVGGLVDPETCAQDMVIGVRFDKGS
ncbi:unnamed protein product, partial [marine sediment metagenome]